MSFLEGKEIEADGGRLDELIGVLEGGFREVVRSRKKVEEEMEKVEEAVA